MSSIEDFFVIVAIRIIECDICGISECGDEVMNIEWRGFGRDMIIFFFWRMADLQDHWYHIGSYGRFS